MPLRFEPPEGVDLTKPYEIAPRLWWVGHHAADDPFQCHVYLLEHGDQSVLFDPGSTLTFRHTLRKIAEIIPFHHIRWFVCHHQDPDITGALGLIDQLVEREDARLVTHWRAAALLKHLDLKLPFWEVDANGWKLDLGGRMLEFVFTPYLHFPGAFATFDRATGTLLSSDLFGGFTADDRLYAEDMADFKGVAEFHEHYMPSQDILVSGLLRLREYPIARIAPQHGRIIEGPLVPAYISRLEGLECGIYMLSRTDSDIRRLMKLNELLTGTLRSLAVERDLGTAVKLLTSRVKEVLPVESIAFAASVPSGTLILAPETQYHGHVVAPGSPDCWAERLLNADRAAWAEAHGERAVLFQDEQGEGEGTRSFILPLFGADDRILAVARFELSESTTLAAEVEDILERLAPTLSVAIEREVIRRRLEAERDQLYQRSIRDPLTGLYTRRYVDDAVGRMAAAHERHEQRGFAVVAFDVDHFKRVNDTWGHAVGDQVLSTLGGLLLANARRADVPVRFGGEEFSVYLDGASVDDAVVWAERVRAALSAHAFETATGPMTVAMSAGVALHAAGESLDALNARADRALYDAKRGGRDRVVVADSWTPESVAPTLFEREST